MKKHHWYTILHISIVLHFAAYIVLAAVVLFGNLASQPVAPAQAASFDAKTFIGRSSPDTIHEANPHGVPSYYDWYNNARFYALNQPRPETTHVNFWGEIYADASNVHPTNTRVAVKNCQFWGLIGGTWTLLQNTTLGGGAWSEDYATYIEGIDIRSESDGSQSIYPRPGQNAHFWADTGFYDATGKTFQAAITTCQTRLVLANANGTDDRDSAKYILSMGADWRQPDGSCPFVFGAYICDGMGHGRYIRVQREWRTAVMTSMTSGDLNSLPTPPTAMFAQPDGSYADMAPEIQSFTASPSTVTAGSSATLSWNVTGAGTVSISQGVGMVSGSSTPVSPSATTTYTLTAASSVGSVTAQSTVTVPGSTPVPNSSGGTAQNSGGTSSPTTVPAAGGGSNAIGSTTPSIAPVDINGDGLIDDGEIEVAKSEAAKSATGVDLPVITGGLVHNELKTKMSKAEIAGIAAGLGMIGLSGIGFLWWLRIRKNDQGW